jgi:hypothetical protein
MGNWKGVRLAPQKPIELYNLASDLGESRDVSAERPAITARIQEVMAQAKRPNS